MLGDEVVEPPLGVPAKVVDLVVDRGRVTLLEPDEVVAVVVVDPGYVAPRVSTEASDFALKKGDGVVDFDLITYYQGPSTSTSRN